MNEIKAQIAERKRELEYTENTAQRYWAAWRVLREQTNDLIKEIRQLEEELNHEP